jgi:predicted pyridoxine 5'-phosphate oxidase superfamily flavin-nucleotide-binding protein
VKEVKVSEASPQPNQVLTEDMKRVLGEQRLGFVATVCPDGTPSLSPKGTTAVWDDDHLVFADIRSPGTVRNLRANPAIEVNVVDPIARKGYRFKGEATVLAAGALFEQILAFYTDGTAPVQDARSRIRSIVHVRIDRALPLDSPAYDLGRTEEAVRAQWWSHYARLATGHRPEPTGHDPAARPLPE